MEMIKTFAKSESGAVTVDWVVLTAAIVGLGLAVMAVVSGGVEDLAGDIDTQLTDMGIDTTFDGSGDVHLPHLIRDRRGIGPAPHRNSEKPHRGMRLFRFWPTARDTQAAHRRPFPFRFDFAGTGAWRRPRPHSCRRQSA
jgi:Flp pilus assembly pilin Flp